MHISPFFHHLRSAYEAEIDDLTFDSEGLNILQNRLAQRRKEMDFLLQMLEVNPEMLAVVFHQAFRFTSFAAMDHVLEHESEDLPPWDEVAGKVDIAPWAQELVQRVLQQPKGEWFLTVAAALEYMFNKPDGTRTAEATESEDEDDEREGHDAHADNADSMDSDDERDARAREEAGADWMVEQGFDRKD